MAMPTGLIETLQQLLVQLPMILGITETIFYIFLVIFLGSIAIRGYRGYLSTKIRIPLTFVTGFLCLICSVSLINFMPFFNTGFFKIFRIDLIIWSIVSSFIFLISLYIFSHKIPGFGQKLKVLEDRLKRIENILTRHNIFPKPVKKEDAVKGAMKTLKDHKIEKAELNKDFWKIIMKKDDKKRNVFVDAYTGKTRVERMIDKWKLVGIIIIIAFLLFSLVNFRGFPSINDDLTSMLGISLEDLSKISGTSENLPPECVNILKLSQSIGFSLDASMIYEDEKIKTMIEDSTGKSIKNMFKIEHEGRDFILAITEDDMLCSATMTTFCECISMDLSS